MVIRSCTVLPTCMNCKTLSRGATPPPPLLFSRGLSPGVKQCYADIRWTGLFAPAAASSSSRGISLYRFVELVFEAIDWSKAREIDPSVDFIYIVHWHASSSIYLRRSCRFRFSFPRIPASLIRSGERHRERDDILSENGIVRIIIAFNFRGYIHEYFILFSMSYNNNFLFDTCNFLIFTREKGTVDCFLLLFFESISFTVEIHSGHVLFEIRFNFT